MTVSPVLTVSDVSIIDNGDIHQCRHIIQGLNFTIQKGQVLAIMGASGVGKSLTMMSLLALQPSRFIMSGQVLFCGQVLPIHQPNANLWQDVRGLGIGYLFQDAKNALNPLDNIKTAFAKAFSRTHTSRSSYHHKMVILLQKTQVYHPDLIYRYPHELSGGEAKRVHLALLLALNPTLIIADEPTGHLDDLLRDEILSLLVNLAKQDNKALIIISHDKQVITYADAVMVMRNGRCQVANDDELRDMIITSSKRQRQSSVLSGDTSLLLSVKNLSYHYTPSDLFGGVINKIIYKKSYKKMSVPDFDVKKGEIVGIKGESGVGKSTLAKILTGLNDGIYTNGEILFYDDPSVNILKLSKKTTQSYRPNVILMMQDYAGSLNPYIKINDIIKEGLVAKHHLKKIPINQKEVDIQIMQACHELNLSMDVLQQYPHQLSGGQKARVCLLRSILIRPKILILDEPTAMLDDDNAQQMLGLLQRIRDIFKVSMIIISHDDKVFDMLCDKIVQMSVND